MRPLISIVLPVYNGARYLSEAIESILAQSHERWELFAVDDASTDDTPRILSDFVARDSRITALRNTQNRKLPGSLNVGFERACGDLLTWTSDDNCFHPDALADMASVLHQRPDVDLVYASYTLIDPAGETQSEVKACDSRFLGFRNTVGPCFLYRRRVYARLGNYNENLFLVEDYDYWIRASCHFKFAWMEASLYRYRIHTSSLTALRGQAVAEARERLLVTHLPRMDWMTAGERGLAWLNLARLAAYEGRRSAVRRYLRCAFLASPRILIYQHRHAVADHLLTLASADASLVESISWTIPRDQRLLALGIQAFLGGFFLRWYYRIANAWAAPGTAAKKLVSAVWN